MLTQRCQCSSLIRGNHTARKLIRIINTYTVTKRAIQTHTVMVTYYLKPPNNEILFKMTYYVINYAESFS